MLRVMAKCGLIFLWIIKCALKFSVVPPLQVAVRSIFFTRLNATRDFVGQPEICEVKIIKMWWVIFFKTKYLDSNLTYGAKKINHCAA